MLDDRDHRPYPAPHLPLYRIEVQQRARAARREQVDAETEREIGCAFWAAMLAGGLTLLLAGYGLAALSDRLALTLMAVLP